MKRVGMIAGMLVGLIICKKEQERKRQLISDLWEMHMDIPTIARLARCQEEEVCEITKELELS